MLFLIYAGENFDNCYFFLKLLQRNSFRETQIIMTLSIPSKAKVNAERYVRLNSGT